MNKVSCLSLLSNAVLVWNTVRMTAILSRTSRRLARSFQLKIWHASRPSPYAHVIPNGTYHVDRPLAAVEGEVTGLHVKFRTGGARDPRWRKGHDDEGFAVADGGNPAGGK